MTADIGVVPSNAFDVSCDHFDNGSVICNYSILDVNAPMPTSTNNTYVNAYNGLCQVVPNTMDSACSVAVRAATTTAAPAPTPTNHEFPWGWTVTASVVVIVLTAAIVALARRKRNV